MMNLSHSRSAENDKKKENKEETSVGNERTDDCWICVVLDVVPLMNNSGMSLVLAV